jgi:hypothetical protein
MVTGYNICPMCNKKYSPKTSQSKLKLHDENVCMRCYGKITVLNPKSKSGIVIYIDEHGHKRWQFKTNKGAIYGKLKDVM